MIVLFHCGHVQTQKLVSEQIDDMCYTCGKMVLIEDTWREQWHISCPRCPYHTKHGYAKPHAEASAKRHLASHGHNVKPQWRSDAPAHIRQAVRKISFAKQTETLPIDPPF